MLTRLNPRAVETLLASLGDYHEQTKKYFESSWQNHVVFLERNGFKSPEDLVDAAFNRVAQQVANGRIIRSQVATPLLVEILRIAFPGEEAKALQTELPSTPPLDHLRHLLQTRFPVLYAQVLKATLADLRLEYSAALAEGRPWKARRVLLQGCAALAAATICQLGYSALDRITDLWQARSPK